MYYYAGPNKDVNAFIYFGKNLPILQAYLVYAFIFFEMLLPILPYFYVVKLGNLPILQAYLILRFYSFLGYFAHHCLI